MQAIKTLKLNANNIKSTLIRGNKDLKKIRAQEKSLLASKKRDEQKVSKEKFVESKGKSSMIGGVAKKMMAPAMSFIDKIKEFLGLLLLGFAVNNLPNIIKGVQKFLDENQWIFKALGAIFSSLGFVVPVFIEIVEFFNPGKRAEMERERKELKAKIDSLVGITGDLDTDSLELFDEVDADDDEPLNRDDDQVVKDIREAIKDQAITKKQFETSINAYRKAMTNNKPTTEPINIAGVGSFERTNTNLGFGKKVVTKDLLGREITPEMFQERVDTAIFQNSQKSFKDDFLKLAEGGLVRQGSTGQEKVAMREAESLLELRESTLLTSKILETQGNVNDEFQKLTDNFKTYLDLTKPEEKVKDPLSSSPYALPSAETQGPVIQPPAPDPNAKGSVITFDGAQGRDRSGEPGVDFSYADIMSNFSLFPGKVVEVGSLYGSGYGRHVTVRSVDQGGKEFDALYAHFGRFAVKEGDMVQAGDFLGTVGWDSNKRKPVPGAGNMTGPHTSVDFYEPNSRRGEVTPKYSGAYRLQSLIINHANKDAKTLQLNAPAQTIKGYGGIRPEQVVPVPPGLTLTPFQKKHFSGGKGGLRRSEQLTQTFDGEGMTEVIIIKSTQPIVVPRYIRR